MNWNSSTLADNVKTKETAGSTGARRGYMAGHTVHAIILSGEAPARLSGAGHNGQDEQNNTEPGDQIYTSPQKNDKIQQ